MNKRNDILIVQRSSPPPGGGGWEGAGGQTRLKAEMEKILAFLAEPAPKEGEPMSVETDTEVSEALCEFALLFQDASTTGLSFGGPQGGGGSYQGQLIFAKAWSEYISGRTKTLTVDVKALNLSHVSQSDLGKDGSVNLANPEIFGAYAFTGTALALGSITLIPQGNNMYQIKDDVYDFDIRENEGWSFRNIATGIAGIIHGGVYDNFSFLSPYQIPMYQPGFPIHFEGSVYIKP